MYSEIYTFCKVRNIGNVFKNTSEPTPRVSFLLDLLDRKKIPYKLDKFKSNNIYCYNIILKGNSDKFVVAHHDVANPLIDNANDNSASVINAIALKRILPDINVAILDGEEVGGLGSKRLSKQINNGEFGKIKWVLNLELSGKGGENFFIGNYPGKLFDHIKSLFNCPHYNTPYNDSVTFRNNGIDSVVINPLPVLNEGKSIIKYNNNYLDNSILYNCHTEKDTIDSVDPKDMRIFVEKVLVKILS